MATLRIIIIKCVVHAEMM